MKPQLKTAPVPPTDCTTAVMPAGGTGTIFNWEVS